MKGFKNGIILASTNSPRTTYQINFNLPPLFFHIDKKGQKIPREEKEKKKKKKRRRRERKRERDTHTHRQIERKRGGERDRDRQTDIHTERNGGGRLGRRDRERQ